MQAVCAFDDVQPACGDGLGRQNGEGGAIESAILHGFTCPQRNQHLGEEAFPVHIAARFGITFGRALFGTEKEVIHMKQGAAIQLPEERGERRFSAGACAVQS